VISDEGLRHDEPTAPHVPRRIARWKRSRSVEAAHALRAGASSARVRRVLGEQCIEEAMLELRRSNRPFSTIP